MPTYLYECKTCGRDIEHFQRIHDDALTTILHMSGPELEGPICEGPVKRLIAGGVSVVWKGGPPTSKTYV